ncbi:Putative Rho GTPase activation protein [Septoria linicola]|uniref:Rho GTPase activation protein n=1 Tax=Septoria linicola TaxID=215465 RepID=A0A9Q9ARA0_9PEZI|nr:putative Rho GTPase activation protein [Septoria linicola]USW53974.1 Putative Rho GTPase activation protein [Septoria linicola]
MSDKSARRRSGVWHSDAVEQEKSRSRNRWGREKQSKDPSMYDEYLTQGRQPTSTSMSTSGTQTEPKSSSSRRPSMPLRQGNTAVNSSGTQTIRAVTPEDGHARSGVSMDYHQRNGSGSLPVNTTMNFEQVFIPHTTTTIVGGAAARDSPSGSTSSRSRRRGERDKEVDRSQTISPASSRNGSVNISNTSFLGRSESKSNGQWTHGVMAESGSSSRPRTSTNDERRRGDTSLNTTIKNRIGSVQSPSSPIGGAEYLASVPASTEPITAPSVSSLGSPVISPSHTPQGHRSISPVSSSTADSITSALPSANARRILHLMKTLNGRMSGNVIFRRGFGNPWSQSYCYIHEESGSLMYESRGSEGAHKTLVPELRGSTVRSNLDGDMPYLEITFPDRGEDVHIKLQTQSDFDAWFAALLHWTPKDTASISSNEPRPDPDSTNASTMSEHTRRRASVNNPVSPQTRDRASSNRSQKSDRRKSVIAALPKENPVIKIGKMIYWDTNIGYNSSGAATLGQPSSSRPNNHRMQSVGSRRWRRISGQLRENGELKLHSDADNSLISVVQLSQLSRCAIQRLDSSVLENDFCIAIYPQYTASYTNTQPGFIRPIFLSLESRVLYEVWFVLLRAFTMPSIYGPRIDSEPENGNANSNRDLESMIATSTTYTFRMERSLSVRVVEAKMQSPNGNESGSGIGLGSSHGRQQANGPTEKHGYYAEVLLDNETRGKTVLKYEGLNPLWGESFEFQDLPPVLNNASVIIKRRPPEQDSPKQDSKHKAHDTYGEEQGGFTSLAFDHNCGKVEIQMEELEPEKEVEKWWPVTNMHGHQVGEVLIKVRADEGIILMARDYQQLSELLHRFSNALTSQIAQMIPSELKRLSDSLLNIFQVSGKAGDWIMALVEEEIDGIHKETPITRLRYSRRVGSESSGDPLGTGGANTDRELIVRDLNKNATLEANLLFRGNTLLTKSLDTHMRRVGKEYLEESLAAKLQEINEKDLDCEVDPNRVSFPQDVDRNWRRLLLFTQEVWKGIVAQKHRCPIELRMIFRHVRACAEDRYGDFLRTVSYSSVSGFLFLRFFCPAVLNPKLFGLLTDDIKPRARRTFTLIAKSLQTMANMASFGTKEPWMEPMNAFLVQHRESFKTFIDDVCHVPAPISGNSFPNSGASPTWPSDVVSAERHLSYTTPMTIMQRLPPSSREGFPSLPYLIDQARSFADLIHLWLEALAALSSSHDSAALPGKTHSDILNAINASEGDLKEFHQLCEELNARTQECLNRAERAERPDSPGSFQWEDVINQLQKAHIRGQTTKAGQQDPFDLVADRIANDPSLLPDDANPAIEATLAQLRGESTETVSDDDQTKRYTSPSGSAAYSMPRSQSDYNVRPGSHSLGGSTMSGSTFSGGMKRDYPQSIGSPIASANASMSNVSGISSAVSSDTEYQSTTALPSYEKEVRHRERREMARVQIRSQMEASDRTRDKEKKERKTNKLLPPGLRKKKDKDVPSRSANSTPLEGQWKQNGMI